MRKGKLRCSHKMKGPRSDGTKLAQELCQQRTCLPKLRSNCMESESCIVEQVRPGEKKLTMNHIYSLPSTFFGCHAKDLCLMVISVGNTQEHKVTGWVCAARSCFDSNLTLPMMGGVAVLAAAPAEGRVSSGRPALQHLWRLPALLPEWQQGGSSLLLCIL